MLDPQVEARSWDEQLALDDVAYRAQLAYLLERSSFYRDKLERWPLRTTQEGSPRSPGFRSPRRPS